ncbi:DEAD/DEAH box helicase [Enterococcus sp. DIV1059_2]|uniref:DEAD/DEAH box helicase n=1 Tax=Enterococcus sp. DIV1059_2 TaxID=2774664 RepID=UPI003F28B70B
MAYALKSFKSLNALRITLNGKNSSQSYAKFMNFLETHQHHQEDDFTYYIPLSLFNEWMENFSFVTTMVETENSIRGIEEPINLEFPIVNKHIDTMKLTPFAFQKVGISYLVSNKVGIIGDEMGLGKTLQALGAAYYLKNENILNKIIVICPSAVKYQWAEEVEKFTDMSAVVLDGNKTKREKILEVWSKDSTNFLLANYELVRNDIEAFESLPFDCIILDEAHRMKNRTSKTFQAVARLQPEYRFALTGTPMQNKPEEAFALMSWIAPDVFGGITKFREKHVVVGEKFGKRFVDLGYKNLDEIREKMAPFILRRLKKDVADELPTIVHSTSYSEMNAPQKAVYTAIETDKAAIQKTIKEIYETSAKAQSDPNFRTPEEELLSGFRYMQIAVSDHPHLLLQGKSKMAKKYLPLLKKCKTSPKMEELFETLKPLIENGHKVVMFSTYTTMLKIIYDRFYTQFDQEPYVIAGHIDAKQRQAQIKRFREYDDRQIMLCSDAANYGINLQFADVLINYDLPWNPAVIEQRYGRIHRIGSTYEQVTMIDMVTKDTIDEKILKTLETKRDLNSGLIEKTEEEIRIMIKQLEEIA